MRWSADLSSPLSQTREQWDFIIYIFLSQGRMLLNISVLNQNMPLMSGSHLVWGHMAGETKGNRLESFSVFFLIPVYAWWMENTECNFVPRQAVCLHAGVPDDIQSRRLVFTDDLAGFLQLNLAGGSMVFDEHQMFWHFRRWCSLTLTSEEALRLERTQAVSGRLNSRCAWKCAWEMLSVPNHTHLPNRGIKTCLGILPFNWIE